MSLERVRSIQDNRELRNLQLEHLEPFLLDLYGLKYAEGLYDLVDSNSHSVPNIYSSTWEFLKADPRTQAQEIGKHGVPLFRFLADNGLSTTHDLADFCDEYAVDHVWDDLIGASAGEPVRAHDILPSNPRTIRAMAGDYLRRIEESPTMLRYISRIQASYYGKFILSLQTGASQ